MGIPQEQVPIAAAGNDQPPATAHAGTFLPQLQQAPGALAPLDGYGDLCLGMDAAQARAA